ncbi:hypothetical protein [Shewanella livingstonensis]|nr:hypothetical protein [Shewanella livingstonensis]
MSQPEVDFSQRLLTQLLTKSKTDDISAASGIAAVYAKGLCEN